jgi:CBS domain-containing protein
MDVAVYKGGTMTVGSICSRVVVTASSQETIRAAAQRMAANDVGTLVVLETTDGALPIGIVTDRDIVLRCVAADLNPDRDRIDSIVSCPLRTVEEQAPVEEAMESMARAGTRRLAVVDRAGSLVGLLSLDDVLDLLADDAGAIGRLLAKQHGQVPVAAGPH